MVKRTLAIMVLALVMVLSLAACGMGSNSDANGAAANRPADSAGNSTVPDNPADNGGISAPNGAAIYGGMNGSGRDRSIHRSDPSPDWDAEETHSRYALMLDNARVRDTDGFLFDGENPQHNTFY